MAAPVVNSHRCPEDHPCPGVRACPFGAMYQAAFSAPQIDSGKCTGCGLCARICPFGAISAVVSSEGDRMSMGGGR